VDLYRLAVDAPAVIRAFLANVAQGDLPKAEQAAKGLRAPTRELFEVGLEYAGSPKAILEEHLQAVLLRGLPEGHYLYQRMPFHLEQFRLGLDLQWLAQWLDLRWLAQWLVQWLDLQLLQWEVWTCQVMVVTE